MQLSSLTPAVVWARAFLDQDFDEARYVVDTNVTGTIYLIHKVGRKIRAQGEGRILITGSIAGFMPGSYQAVYNGTKAFLTRSPTRYGKSSRTRA